MSKRGRFGKYGEIKRLERLRHSGDRSYLKKTVPGGGARVDQPSFFPSKQRIGLIVRPVKSSDLEFIRELSEIVFKPYGPYHKTLPRWVESGSTVTFVAEEKGMARGFAILGPGFRDKNGQWTAELLAIAVRPLSQRKGIGKKLLETILDAARRLGVRKLILHTAERNQVAKTLFARYGFKEEERKAEFYSGGQNAILMARPIEI